MQTRKQWALRTFVLLGVFCLGLLFGGFAVFWWIKSSWQSLRTVFALETSTTTHEPEPLFDVPLAQQKSHIKKPPARKKKAPKQAKKKTKTSGLNEEPLKDSEFGYNPRALPRMLAKQRSRKSYVGSITSKRRRSRANFSYVEAYAPKQWHPFFVTTEEESQ